MVAFRDWYLGFCQTSLRAALVEDRAQRNLCYNYISFYSKVAGLRNMALAKTFSIVKESKHDAFFSKAIWEIMQRRRDTDRDFYETIYGNWNNDYCTIACAPGLRDPRNDAAPLLKIAGVDGSFLISYLDDLKVDYRGAVPMCFRNCCKINDQVCIIV